MDYYVIRPSLNQNIIGHYPQVKEVKYKCHVWDEPKFVEHLHFEKANFQPITANAVLYNKSKITDLIDVVGMGFTKKLLISGKLKSIIQLYINDGVQFFQSGIYYKNTFIEDYWVMNTFNINMDFIDFKRSNFVFRKRKNEGGTYIENTNIKSKEEFYSILMKKKEYGYTQFFIDKIKLLNNVEKDFFVLTHVEGGVKYVVSERLKNEIENTKCTGLEFMPLGMRLTDWLQGGAREKIYGKT